MSETETSTFAHLALPWGPRGGKVINWCFKLKLETIGHLGFKKEIKMKSCKKTTHDRRAATEDQWQYVTQNRRPLWLRCMTFSFTIYPCPRCLFVTMWSWPILVNTCIDINCIEMFRERHASVRNIILIYLKKKNAVNYERDYFQATVQRFKQTCNIPSV